MYWTRYRRFVLATVLAASALALLRGAAPQVDTGIWRATGPLSSVRAGAASALLPDGGLLVTGGAGPEGAVSTTEVLGSSNAFSPAASMITARSDHGAVPLSDGGVLVVGGRNADGALASAEIYYAGEWFPAGDLTDARWGHTATLLADGRVLIAGGENAAGVLASVELFDPNSETFSVVGTLSSPRKGHAAARLADGRVVIAGGFSGDAALSSIDVFDPETESIGPMGVSLETPRAGLSATTLLDGKVLFFGGNDGSNDLATSEIFDAAAGTIIAGPAAPAARRDHQAFLLPNNNAVLIVGGATADGASASAELYQPWLKQFWGGGTLAAPRYRSTGSALSQESYGDTPSGNGVLVVAGGEGQSSSEAYGFATIRVDKDDYSPGETVYVSGRGWQPGDVTFELREVVAEHTSRLFTLTADEHGVIPTQELFLVEQHHLGVRFYLTAHDAASQAQIAFSDGNAVPAPSRVPAAGYQSISAGSAFTFDITYAKNGGGGDIQLQNPLKLSNKTSGTGETCGGSGTTIPANWMTVTSTLPVTVSDTVSPIVRYRVSVPAGAAAGNYTAAIMPDAAGGGAQTFDLCVTVSTRATTSLNVAAGTGTYGGSVNLSGTLTSGASGIGGKSLVFTLNGTSVGSATTNASGTATLTNVSLSGINAGSYTGAIGASFAGDSGFAASSGTANLTVNPLSVNLIGTRPYDGTSTAAASILTVTNLVGSDAVTVATGNATLASKDVGSRAITDFSGLTLGGASATNYTSTGATGTVTIMARVVQLTGTRPYDGTTDVAASVLSVSNAASGDTVNVASGTATVASKDVGSRTITALGTLTLGNNASGNYTLSAASGTVTITARAVLLTGTRGYDGTADAPASILTISNLAAGDSVNVASGAATLASKNAGSQAIANLGTLALGNNASGNYTLTGASGTVTITSRAVTLTGSRVYDGTSDAAASILSVSNAVGGDTVSVASGIATLAAKDVGAQAITSAGTLALGNNDAGNYTVTGATGTVAITVRPITFKADDVTRVYGDSTPAFAYSVTSGSIVNADAFGTPDFSAPATSVGTHTITLGGLANSNYDVTFVTGTLIVTPRPITFKADDVTRVYGESTPAFSYSIKTGTIVNDDAFGAPAFSVPASTVGTHLITLSALANPNYTVSFDTGTLTVTARPITFKADEVTRVYGESTPAFTYTVGAGSVVSGDEFGSPSFSVLANTVGTHVITLSGLANPNYAVTFVDGTLTVKPRPITFKADDVTRVYGETTPAFGYSATAGSIVNGDTFGAPSFSVPANTVGTHVITLSGLANPNYAVTFVDGTLTVTPRPITFKADDVTRVYGESTPAFGYAVTAGSIVNGDEFGSPSFSVPANTVGTHVITLSGLANPNYAVTFVDGTLTVKPRPITFKADDVTRVYGETTPAFGYSATAGSIVNGDTFGAPSFSVPANTVGTHVITLTGLANANYAVTFVDGTLTVTPRPITFKANDVTRVYGESTPAFTYRVGAGSVVNGDEFGSPSFSGPANTVGTHVITLSGLGNPNYAVTFVAGTLTVTPRPVTVTADGQTKLYGDNDLPLTYKVTAGSVVNGDAFTGNLSRAGGENVGVYAIQQGTLALNSNYALTYVGANLTIDARPITITANPEAKTYGGMDPALTYQVTSGGLVNGDAFSGALTRTPGENAGTYPILQGSLTAGANYKLTFVGALLTINKAALTVAATATPALLTYPGVPSIGVAFAGFVNNETPAVLGGALVQTLLVGDVVVGTAPVTTALPPGTYAVHPSGFTAANYIITYTDGAFTITNTAPVIVSVTGSAPLAIGSGGTASATLNVSFTDLGVIGDTFVVGSEWTTASGATPSSVSYSITGYGGLNGTATLTATGLAPGVYSVLVRVTDRFAAASAPYEYRYVVIYDPAGGFVTGGGWIDSPASACQSGIVGAVCTGSPTGKANFGFVAKYLKGQQKPDGNTEFQFQAGNLSFKSTDYEWLVISGTTQAQFKGSGTINGSGSYGFILTAIDGDNFGNKKPDSFRLKIWDKLTGSTVYDNQLGKDETSLTDATFLGGGSIVIHSK